MQGLAGVGSGDEDVFAFTVVAHHIGFACRLHLYGTLNIFRLGTELCHARVAHHVTIGAFLFEQSFVFQVDKKIVHYILSGLVLDTHDFADLLVVLWAERLVGKNAQDNTRKSAQFILDFFLFCHGDFEIFCKDK